MTEYLFSAATEADALNVFSLYRSLIGTPGCTWSAEYPTMDFVLQDIASGSLYTLRDSQGRIIAAASAGPLDELANLPWALTHPCELARVAVSLPLQNRGIGSFLLSQVCSAVKARRFDGICMLVNKNHPHALALYEKNGFSRCGEIRLYGFDFFRYRMAFSDPVAGYARK